MLITFTVDDNQFLTNSSYSAFVNRIASKAVFVMKLYQKLTLVFKMKSPAMEPEWSDGPNIPVIFNSIFKKAVILKFV